MVTNCPKACFWVCSCCCCRCHHINRGTVSQAQSAIVLAKDPMATAWPAESFMWTISDNTYHSGAGPPLQQLCLTLGEKKVGGVWRRWVPIRLTFLTHTQERCGLAPCYALLAWFIMLEWCSSHTVRTRLKMVWIMSAVLDLATHTCFVEAK